MTRIRWFLVWALLAGALVAVWLWWVRPKKVDMASYAPANSLVYLESNSPLAVVEAIADTDGWNVVAQVIGSSQNRSRQPWLQRFVGWTGIGPVQSVILSRAQLAIVVTDLGTTAEGDTLKIKPQGAVLIETHTTESRIRAPVEENLKKLAQMTYGRPTLRRTSIDGVEFIEWTAPEGSRQIVAAIVGSLVIVGNSEQSVKNCLTVSQQHGPSLKDDPDLQRKRRQLAGDSALTFGYVPSVSSPRLLSVGVPLIFGRAPDDLELQRLLTTAAGKVFGSLGWSSHAFMKGIEDRYLIALQPSVIARLKQGFPPVQRSSQIQQLVPDDVYSVTYYKFENPAGTWQDLKGTVASQLDVLSALLFSSLLKASLVPYGIDDPDKFLGAATAELVTLRLDQGERSMLVAGVRNRESMRELVRKKMTTNSRKVGASEIEIFEDTQNEMAAAFVEDFVVMGSTIDVRRFIETAKTKAALSAERSRQVTFFVPLSSKANIITYTDDSERVRSFISAIVAANGGRTDPSIRVEELIARLPYSATETTLGEQGIERTTRSPLGQFSTLLPLLFPEPVNLNKGAQPQ
ncbi:MAG: hypothetical protein M3R69_04800 [Acidobacteriota bacterium]|nr:hypothetical protein [Acidobacteriota bacterium]